MQKINIDTLRRTLSPVVLKTAYCNERYIVCRNFKEVAVILSWEDWKVIEKMFKANDEKRELKE